MSDAGDKATLVPLGDAALLVRFADSLSDAGNRAAIAFWRRIQTRLPEGVAEVAPGLVSVLLRLQPGANLARLRGEVALLLGGDAPQAEPGVASIAIDFDGDDLGGVAGLLGMSARAFVERHNATPLRVLATGFAPGFLYCGFHSSDLVVPRRESVRPMVPAGTVLFAAGQTAIAATPIRTGWHVIGRTAFRNFDASTDPPTRLHAGNIVLFTEAP